MKNLKIQSLAAIMLVTSAMGMSVRASSYDVAADFSILHNPNGVWTYGQYIGALTFVPFAYVTEGSGDLSGIYQWSDVQGPADPNVDFNTGPEEISSGVDFLPGKVTLGPYLGPTVVRFTAPTAGPYDLSATFTTVQTVNTDPTAYVVIGGVNTPSGTFIVNDPGSDQIGTPWTYSASNVVLAKDETIDFVVWGNNTDNKTIQLDATITPDASAEVAAVPLPASAGVGFSMLAGFGVLFAFRKHLKRKSRIA